MLIWSFIGFAKFYYYIIFVFSFRDLFESLISGEKGGSPKQLFLVKLKSRLIPTPIR